MQWRRLYKLISIFPLICHSQGYKIQCLNFHSCRAEFQKIKIILIFYKEILTFQKSFEAYRLVISSDHLNELKNKTIL